MSSNNDGVIGKKWVILIVYNLLSGPFSQLYPLRHYFSLFSAINFHTKLDLLDFKLRTNVLFLGFYFLF